MFYISRRTGVNKYGVVDTDDGVEGLFTYEDLRHAVCDLGLDIKGVKTNTMIQKRRTVTKIVDVQVYQDSSTVTSSQVKLSFLNGIHIKTNGTEIVGVSGDFPLKEPSMVRLSKYGSSCADYLFSYVRTYGVGCLANLTVVLDDNIKVSSKAFKRAPELGLCFDIREVTSDKVASYVYRETLGVGCIIVSELHLRVLDKPERLNYWKAVLVLNRGFNVRDQYVHIMEAIDDVETVCRQIDKVYVPEFLSVSKCSLSLSARGRMSHLAKNYCKWLMENKSLLNGADYTTLRANFLTPLFHVLKWDTNCNKNVIERYGNYIQYFFVHEDVKKAFVEFCIRANNFFLEMGKKEGWI